MKAPITVATRSRWKHYPGFSSWKKKQLD